VPGSVKEIRKGVGSMITAIRHNEIMLVNGTTEVVSRSKPIDEKKTDDTAVIPKVEMGTDNGKEVPQDEVGKCDNLTASYWG